MTEPARATDRTKPRAQRATETRAAIAAAAYDLFCTLGYASTTMKDVATRAGYAVQTVYFVFHTKAQLLGEVIEITAAGRPGELPVPERPWLKDALAGRDGRRVIALTVEGGADIYARMAPLVHAVREAALVDPHVRETWATIGARRKAAMRRLAETIADAGAIREDLSIEHAADVMHALNSHDTYLELVRECGWEIVDYKRWLYRTLCEVLLTRAAIAAPGATEVTADLSFRQ